MKILKGSILKIDWQEEIFIRNICNNSVNLVQVSLFGKNGRSLCLKNDAKQSFRL